MSSASVRLTPHRRPARWAALAIIVAALAHSPPVRAFNTDDLNAITIPASSCQPENSNTMQMLALINSGWVFNGSATGTAGLYCPLPLSSLSLHGGADSVNEIDVFRVHYRDSDGSGSTAQVTVSLLLRKAEAQEIISTKWDSNNLTNTEGSRGYQPMSKHRMDRDALYGFYVTISRTSTNQSPAFFGIDFRQAGE